MISRDEALLQRAGTAGLGSIAAKVLARERLSLEDGLALLRTANPSRNILELKKLRQRVPGCQQIRHNARVRIL